MGSLEQEIIPLTERQIRAVKACRFSTCTQDVAWLWTDNNNIVEDLGDLVRQKENYLRDSVTGKREWEMRCAHPQIMEMIRNQYQ